MGTHACGGPGADGSERLHRLEHTGAGAFAAELVGGSGGLNLYLYDAALSNCIAWGDASLLLPSLSAASYVLVVDGPAGSEGPYTLRYDSTP